MSVPDLQTKCKLRFSGGFMRAGRRMVWAGPGGVASVLQGSISAAHLRGEECCCENPCFPSARLAVNGAVLMGLVRGLQLISVVLVPARRELVFF